MAIERTFGLWKRSFPRLSKGMNFNPEKCAVIVVACVVLYNFAKLHNDIHEDEEDQRGPNDENNLVPDDAQGSAKRRKLNKIFLTRIDSDYAPSTPIGRGRGRGVAPQPLSAKNQVPTIGGPRPASNAVLNVVAQVTGTVVAAPTASSQIAGAHVVGAAIKVASTEKASSSSLSVTSVGQLTAATASLSLRSQSSAGAGGDATTATIAAETLPWSHQQQSDEQKKSSNSVSGDSAGSKSSSGIIPIETRPGYGTLGRRLRVRSNYFRLAVKADQDGNVIVHHYRIEITHVKKVLKRYELRELFWEIMLTQSNFVQEPWTLFYDGGNSFYTQKKISVPANFETSYRFALPSDIRPSDYNVKITYIGELTIDVNNTTANTNRFAINNMLDLLFHQYYSLPQRFIQNEKKRFVNAGRSFFFIPTGPNDSISLSRTCEIWQGYFAASKLGRQNCLYLNFDTSHTTFFAMKSALEFLCDSLNNAFNTNMYNVQGLSGDTVLPDRLIKAFEKEIKSMKVTTTHNNTERVYKVIRVSDLSAVETEFQRNDAKTSVAEYFSEVYNINLRFPRLPCLIVGTKRRNISLPLEVCKIHRPQKYNRKLNEKQTADMIKAVCIDAPSREDRIGRLMSMARFENDPFLRSFGVRVDNNMVTLEARLVEPPTIQFGNKQVDPKAGVWSLDRSSLYQCVPSTDYALVSMVDDRESSKLGRFCDALCQTANQLGIKNFRRPAKVIYLKSLEQIESTIKDLQNTEIKRLGDVVYGVITQCVLMRVVQDPKPMTMGNLVLKINAKFGGVNGMICGAEM
uniref:PAZ domain-containing protein n=1 Tax=Romanomermis culicivorax TaxID=13658 RepID=A0A915K614_ROMCU